ncbi:MAG TPA: hypothetical protein VGK19_04085 [Capsulimonadaceae bacterium]|jgi:hypothetical protein
MSPTERLFRIIASAVVLTTCTSMSLAALAPASPIFNANDPASTGYTLTFADEFDDASSIDTGATGQPGYKWYTKQFFGGKTTPTSCISVRRGVLTVDGPDGCNASLETACPASTPTGYVGTVFGGGGYFEASIAFDPKLIDIKHGFPSFWSMAIEHMAFEKGRSQWQGQDPGYEHFIEIDFFEANTFAKAGPFSYSGAVHDWYGKWSKEKGIPGNNMNYENYIVGVPSKTDFNKFHRYGCLVVTASPATNGRGFIQYYFDGLPTSDLVTWSGHRADDIPPPGVDKRYSIADTTHLNVLLGCATGNKMRVDYVRVWQLDKAATSADKTPLK